MRNLLTFARKGGHEKIRGRPQRRGARDLAAPRLRAEAARASTRAARWTPPGRVLGDPYELQQVMLNLLTNAMQAVSSLPAGRPRKRSPRAHPAPRPGRPESGDRARSLLQQALPALHPTPQPHQHLQCRTGAGPRRLPPDRCRARSPARRRTVQSGRREGTSSDHQLDTGIHPARLSPAGGPQRQPPPPPPGPGPPDLSPLDDLGPLLAKPPTQAEFDDGLQRIIAAFVPARP